MKRLFRALLISALCIAILYSSAFAADGSVTYGGNAGDFIFAPGSMFSPTDLFPNYKDVMPGDSISQKITVKNNADMKVKVKIYMRSLGADDAVSADFLSKLMLTVKCNDDTPLYLAPADQTAQLTDWVCLGLFYSGAEVDLDCTLDVPITLDNDNMSLIGYLDWQFMVEEFPVEPDDPKPPKTGDEFEPILWMGLIAASLLVLFIFRKRKNSDEGEETAV